MITNLNLLPNPKALSGYDENRNYAVRSFRPLIHTDKPDWKAAIGVFCGYAEKAHGLTFTEGKGGVELVFDYALDKGHYRIDTLSSDAVLLMASDYNGICYALASLLQIMDGANVPALTVYDYPECSYRTLMVDLAREWHTFDQVLNFVDLCFLYKASYLHLHFIDSQSYTLPSDEFPNLPTKDRHYTKEQIAELVAYAKERGVTLIPEFEAPGHATEMIRAYPELFGCTEGSGPEGGLVCAGKPGVYDSLDRIITEICALFPDSPYIHIGGDEADIRRWNECPDCRAFMEKNGLDSVKALYTEFVRIMTRIVLAHNRKPIVWEGFPKEGAEKISRDTIVISWENLYHLTPDLLEEGFNVINASWQPLYIVPEGHEEWTPYTILEWDLYTWRNWWYRSAAFLNPIHVQPTDQVIGAQLCAWECTYEQEIQQVKEKLAALLERTWTIRRYLNNEQFRVRMEHLVGLADRILR